MASAFGASILAFHRVTGRCPARGCRAIWAPSRGTLRWTLTGPGAGAGSAVAAIRAPGPPPRMRPPQLAHQRLGLRGHSLRWFEPNPCHTLVNGPLAAETRPSGPFSCLSHQ